MCRNDDVAAVVCTFSSSRDLGRWAAGRLLQVYNVDDGGETDRLIAQHRRENQALVDVRAPMPFPSNITREYPLPF